MTIIIVFIGKGFKIVKRFIHFLDDFVGEEERPGQERKPGVSERLFGLENCVTSISEKFDHMNEKVVSIEKELHPNHGSSMRDAIDRIQVRLDILEGRFDSDVIKR